MSSAENTNKNRFLESLAGAGRLETEQREFTINEKLALKKLSNVLEDRQQWVLKAVQAGVAGQATSMSFQLGRLVQDSPLTKRASSQANPGSSILPLFDLGLDKDDHWNLSSSPQTSLDFQANSWAGPPIFQRGFRGVAKGRFLAWMVPKTRQHRSLEVMNEFQVVPQKAEILWLRHGVVCSRETVLYNSSARMILALESEETRSGLDGLSLTESVETTLQAGALFSRFWEDIEPLLARCLPLTFPLPTRFRRQKLTQQRGSRPGFRIALLLVMGIPAILAVAAVSVGIAVLVTGDLNSSLAIVAAGFVFLGAAGFMTKQTKSILAPDPGAEELISSSRVLSKLRSDMKSCGAG